MDIEDVRRHIVSRPDIMLGKPVGRGTRIPVHVIVDLVAVGMTDEQIVDDYPDITVSNVRVAVAYAALHDDSATRVARSA